MAINRVSDTQSADIDRNETLIPDSAVGRHTSKAHETSDFRQIEKQYDSDAESGKGGFSTGALIPQDMTVKLVRAETANWETFLSILFSITLTLFGLFMGAWISSSNTGKSSSSLEVVATIAFGVLSAGLIILWGILKVRQQRLGVKIPYEVLNSYSKTEQKAPQDASHL